MPDAWYSTHGEGGVPSATQGRPSPHPITCGAASEVAPARQQPEGKAHDVELGHLTYTDADINALADELGVDRGVALDRVNGWERAISDTARGLIKEQLASVIVHNQPAHTSPTG